MSATPRPQKLDSFNFRIEPELKAAFTAAADAADRPAAQVLREFMRRYVDAQREAKLRADARKASLTVAAAEADPDSDGAQIQRELDANFEDLLRDEPDY